jgi:uncharacterized membrane protein
MMRLLRQVLRGCGDLPGVGPHPGSFYLVAFILMGALAGARGHVGPLAGALIMAAVVVPLYLLGAYERAEESDRLEWPDRRANAKK